jgi:hypothetical protein
MAIWTKKRICAINSVAKNISQIISLVNDILIIQEMDLILQFFILLTLFTCKKCVRQIFFEITDTNVKIVDRLDDQALFISGEEIARKSF